MTNLKEKANYNVQMEIILMEILKILNCMEMASLPGLMVMFILANGFIMLWKDKVIVYKQMVILIKANGN